MNQLVIGTDTVEEKMKAVESIRSALLALEQGYRSLPVPELEQAMIDLRIAAFREARWETPTAIPQPRKATVANGQLAEIDAADLDSETLHSAVVGGGGLIVRGLLHHNRVEQLKALIDEALLARRDMHAGEDIGPRGRHYARPRSVEGGPAQFVFKNNEQRFGSTGSMWAVDSPPAACALLELYEQLGIPELLRDCFGEPGVLSVKKWVLRKAEPKPEGKSGWHQDGRFLGQEIRTINLWVALSHCGGSAPAPGMEIVADHRKVIHETGTKGAFFDWVVGPELVQELAEHTPVLAPEFQAGDALFFDHFNLHRTQCSPLQTDCRYAVESWFFAASNAPKKVIPLLL
ncbi:MAG: phytanoyl-CoA dioxygenase family protein [Pseudomonadota bacterium]